MLEQFIDDVIANPEIEGIFTDWLEETNTCPDLLQCLTSKPVSRITHLTEAEKSCLSLWKSAWNRICVGTQDFFNKPLIRKLLSDLYLGCNIDPPKKFIWVESPLEGAIVIKSMTQDIENIHGFDENISEAIRKNTLGARERTMARMFYTHISKIRDNIGYNEFYQLFRHIKEKLGLKQDAFLAWRGLYYSNWLSFYSFLHTVCKLSNLNVLLPQIRLASLTSMWMPFAKTVVVVAKPTKTTIDNDKFYIEYADGFKVFN